MKVEEQHKPSALHPSSSGVTVREPFRTSLHLRPRQVTRREQSETAVTPPHPPEGGSVRKVSVSTWGNGGPPVCWRGCDTVQLCWTTAWGFLKTFHGERAGDPATRLPGSSPGTEGRDSGHYLHTMFTALFLTEGIPTRYLLPE